MPGIAMLIIAIALCIILWDDANDDDNTPRLA